MIKKIICFILTLFLLLIHQFKQVNCAIGGLDISFNLSQFTNPPTAPNTQQYKLIEKALINTSYFFKEIVQLNKETTKLTFTTQNGVNNCSTQVSNGYITPDITDLHIFVSTYSNPADNEIFTGKFCTIADLQRPKFGMIKINFAKIDHITMDANLANQRHMQFYRLAQKSIQNILGFDFDLFSKFIKSPGQLYLKTEVVLTVSTKTYIFLQQFKEYAQTYYQNYKFAGQLGIEFQVLNGVTVWKKRYLYNDIATANTNLNDYIDKLYSHVNALLLSQTGWYSSIKLSRVDFNNWGVYFNKFLDSGDINTCSANMGNTGICSQTFMTIATCASDTYLENKLAEVPYVSCTNINYGNNLDIKFQRGQQFSEKSKCFTSSITNKSESAQTVICTPSLSGQEINVVGVDVEGKITCPNFYDFCALKYACPFDCSQNGYCSRGMCTCNNSWAGYGCKFNKNIVDEKEIELTSCDQNQGFYLAPNKVCLKCEQPCTKCFSQGNGNCTECESGHKLLGNTCIKLCPDGYFETTQEGQFVCLPCAAGCTKCKDSATNCQNCPPGQYEMPDKRCLTSCTPKSDYYQNETTKSCEPCDISCNECTGGKSEDKCIACKDPKEFKNPDDNNKCQTCPPGKYGDDTTKTCKDCIDPCKTCENSAVNCTSCLPGKGPLRKDNKCGPCDPGQYHEVANDVCRDCSKNCLTCIDTDIKCTSCVNGPVLPGNICPPCAAGQYYDGSVCKPCDKTCLTCDGPNKDDCIKCTAPNYLRKDGTCGQCDKDQYVDANGACQNCDISCLTCKDTDKNCTKCKNAGEYLQNPSLTCGPCKSQEYGDQTDQRCKPCDSSCNECTGNGIYKCINCMDPTKFKDPNTKECIKCPQGQFGNTKTGFCEPCHKNCQSCFGPNPTDCSNCIPPNVLKKNGQCGTCDPNQYIESGQCQDCHPTCEKCKNGNDPSDCTECKTPGEFRSDIKPPGKCQPCSPQQYGDKQQNLCLPCDFSCNQCTGGTKSDCIACSQPNHFKNPLNNNICEPCPPKYFGNPKTGFCELCHISCSTCSGKEATNCNSCPAGTYMNIDGSCQECKKNQYIENGIQCKDCDQSCGTCSGPGPTNCTSCKDPGEFLTQPNQECGKCGKQEFGDPVTKKCTPCDTTCNGCTGPGKGDCIQCADPNHFKDPQKNYYCGPCSSLQYGEKSTGSCKPCHVDCKVCYGPTFNECTECQDGKFLQDGHSCVTICPQGTYPLGPPNNLCKPCEDTNCSVCTAPKTCSDCKPPLLLQDKICVIKCSDGFYQHDPDNCKPCHPTCIKCGPTTNKCTECPTDMFIQGETCVIKCNDGYFVIPGQKECISCEVEQCQECNQKNTCVKCNEGYILSKTPDPQNPGQFKYECLIKCNPNCRSCPINNPDQCLSCKDGKVLQGKICQEKCNSGFYKDSSSTCIKCKSNECIQEGYQCHYTCETCYGSGYADCLTCKANRRILTSLHKNIGECNCPATTTDLLQEECDQSNKTQDQLQSASIGLIVVGTIFSVMTSIITSNPLFVFLFLDTCQNTSTLRYLDQKSGLSFDQLASNLYYSNIFTLFPNPNSWSPNPKKSQFSSPIHTRMLDLFAPNMLNQFDQQFENKKLSVQGKTPYFAVNIFALLILNSILWVIALLVRKYYFQDNSQTDQNYGYNNDEQQNEQYQSQRYAREEQRQSNKKSKKQNFKDKIAKYMYISIPIIFSFLTIGESFIICFFGFFNFKADQSSVGIVSNILVFLVMIYYILVIGYVSKNFVRKQTQYEEMTNGSQRKNMLILLWDILETKYLKQRFYPVVYCVKKIIAGLFYVVIVKHPKVQIIMLLLLYFVYWLYIVIVRPFKRNIFKILAITLETITLIIHFIFLLMISQSDRNSDDYTTANEIRYIFTITTLIFILFFVCIVFSIFQFLKFFISYQKKNNNKETEQQKVVLEDISQDFNQSALRGDNFLMANVNKDDDIKSKTNRLEGSADQSSRYQSFNLNNSMQQRSQVELKGLDESYQMNNSMNQHKLLQTFNSMQLSESIVKHKRFYDKSSESDLDNYSPESKQMSRIQQNQNTESKNEFSTYMQKNEKELISSDEKSNVDLQFSDEDSNPQKTKNTAKVISLDQAYDNGNESKQIRRVQVYNPNKNGNQTIDNDSMNYQVSSNKRRINSALHKDNYQSQPPKNNKSTHILKNIMTITGTSQFSSGQD